MRRDRGSKASAKKARRRTKGYLRPRSLLLEALEPRLLLDGEPILPGYCEWTNRQGTPFDASFYFYDPDSSEWTVQLDSNGDGETDQVAVTQQPQFQLTRSYSQVGSYSINATITDAEGHWVSGQIGTVHVYNLVAEPGGPYAVAEGLGWVTLQGGGLSISAGDIVSCVWDLDGDSLFGEEPTEWVPPVTVPGYWGEKWVPAYYDADGNLVDGSWQPHWYEESVTPGYWTDAGMRGDERTAETSFDTAGLATGSSTIIGLHVESAIGAIEEASTTVTILNQAPTAWLGGPYSVGEGGSVGLNAGNSSDPGNNISLYRFSWQLPGGEVQTAEGPTPSLLLTAAVDGPCAVPVTLTVVDSFGATGTTTTTVQVTNRAPEVRAGGDEISQVPSLLVRDGYFSDPGAGPWTAKVNYGDGGNWQDLSLNPDKTFQLSHDYRSAGVYLVGVRVTDEDGGFGSGSFYFRHINIPPVACAGGPYEVDEGASIVLQASASDPTDFECTYLWDLENNGSFESYDCGSAAVVFTAPSVTGATSQTIRVRAIDASGAYDDDVTSILIRNTMLPIAEGGGPYRVYLGQSVMLDATASSGGITEYLWDLDGDGVYGEAHLGPPQWIEVIDDSDPNYPGYYGPPEILGLFGDEWGPTPTFLAVGLEPGWRTVGLRVYDWDHPNSYDEAQIHVLINFPPGVTLGGDEELFEGQTLWRSGGIGDVESLWWSGVVNYGDSSGTLPLEIGSSGAFYLDHQYRDNGIYTVSVTITDDGGEQSEATFTATVLNVAPALVPTTEPLAAQFGQESECWTLATFTDPAFCSIYGQGESFSYTIDWGDGSGTTTGTPVVDGVGENGLTLGSVVASHAFRQNGLVTLTITLADDDGGSSTATLTVEVLSLAPALMPLCSTMLERPDPLQYRVEFTDDNPAEGWTLDVWYGDGTQEHLSATNQWFDLEHEYTADGSYTVHLHLADAAGGLAEGSFTVVAGDLPPVVNLGGPYALDELSSVLLTATARDPGGVDPTSFQWDLDGDGIFETPGAAVLFTANGDGWQNQATVRVRVADTDGGWAVGTTTITINNTVAPTAVLSLPPRVDPDGWGNLSGLGSHDPGNNIVLYEWDLDGDGVFGEQGSYWGYDETGQFVWFSLGDNGDERGAVVGYHSSVTQGDYTVWLRVSDGIFSHTTSGTVRVAWNASPSISVNAALPAEEGAAWILAGSFTDDSSGWIISVDYGDGDGWEPLLFSANNGFTLSHVYQTLGTYTVYVQVVDAEGASSEVELTAEIINTPPSDITLSGTTVAENLIPGTLVGALSTAHVNPHDVFTYSLAAGEGSEDNAAFVVVGSSLVTARTFDYESLAAYSIRLRVSDAEGAWFEKAFTISIVNGTDRPTLDPVDDPEGLIEDVPPPTILLTGISAGPGENQSLTITASADNHSLVTHFIVSDVSPEGTAELGYTLAADAWGTAHVTITVRDAGLDLLLGTADDAFLSRSFTLVVAPAADPPTLEAVPDQVLDEGGMSLMVLLGGITDGDGGTGFLQVTAVSDAPELLEPQVSYPGGSTGDLWLVPVANGYGTATITVRVAEAGSDEQWNTEDDLYVERTFSVAIRAVNDAPTAVDGSVNITAAPYAFAAGDFGFADPEDFEAHGLAAVQVVSLPTGGLLTCGGDAVAAGQWISAASLSAGSFTFQRTAGATPGSFLFRVRDDGGTAFGGVDTDPAVHCLTLNLTPRITLNSSIEGSIGGEWNLSGSIADDGGSWMLFVGYGDDSAPVSMETIDQNFSLTHIFSAAGDYNVVLRVTDAAGAEAEAIAVATVLPPPAILLSVEHFLETAPYGSAIATLTTVGLGPGPVAFSLMSDTDELDNELFAIAGNSLVWMASVSSEEKSSCRLLLRAEPAGYEPFEQYIDIYIDDCDVSPTALPGGPYSVLPGGTLILNGSGYDPDGSVVSYCWRIGEAGSEFAEYHVAQPLISTTDWAHGYYLATLTVTDNSGETGSAETWIEVNAPPTAIVLSTAAIPVDTEAGSVIATLTTVDIGDGPTFVYSLVSGPGDYDNGYFYVYEDQLFLQSPLDYESQAVLYIRLATMDPCGRVWDQAFTLTVQPNNRPPTDISLTTTTVAENLPAGTTVGVFATIDEDAGDTFTYSLAAGAGSEDNAAFAVVGSSLVTARTFDYERKGSYAIRLRSTDAAGEWYEKQFVVTVGDVNDPPTLAAIPNPVVVAEDSGTHSVILSGITSGGEASQSLSLTASHDNAALIAGLIVEYAAPASTAVLRYTLTPDAFGAASIAVTLTDSAGASTTRTFAVNVAPVNDAPTLAGILDQTVYEDSGQHTIRLTGIAAGGGETQPLSVTAVSNNPAVIASPDVVYDGLLNTWILNYRPTADANGTATITVTVTDGGLDGLSGNADDATISRTFTIEVRAVNDAPSGKNATITVSEDKPYVFTVADFGIEDAHDKPANGLAAIQVSPLAGLTLHGWAVTEEWIPVADIQQQALVFTPAEDAIGASFSFVVRDDGGTANGGCDTAVAAAIITLNVVEVNDPPVLNALRSLPSVVANDTAPTGTTVAELLGTAAEDADSTNLGIAVVAAPSDNGVWEFSRNGGATWTKMTGNNTPSETAARLLTATDLVRFVPKTGWLGSATMSVRAWDQSQGTAGGTFNLRDPDANAFSGAAQDVRVAVMPRSVSATASGSGSQWTVTLTNAAEGTWSITVGSVSTVELDASADVGAIQAALSDALGLPVAVTGGEGSTAARSFVVTLPPGWSMLSVDGSRLVSSNTPPSLDDHADFPLIRAGQTSDGLSVSQLLGDTLVDIDGDSLGIAVLGADNSHGVWQYRLAEDGEWRSLPTTLGLSSACLLPGGARLRFDPAATWSGSSSIRFRAWDGTQGAAGGTVDVSGWSDQGPVSAETATSTVLVSGPVSAVVNTDPQGVAALSPRSAVSFDATTLGASLELTIPRGEEIPDEVIVVTAGEFETLTNAVVLDALATVTGITVSANDGVEGAVTISFDGTVWGWDAVAVVVAGNNASASNVGGHPSRNEVQQIVLSGAKRGTWTISIQTEDDSGNPVVETTEPLEHDASANNVAAALETFAAVGSGNVAVTGGGTQNNPFVITFVEGLAGVDMPELTVNTAGLINLPDDPAGNRAPVLLRSHDLPPVPKNAIGSDGIEVGSLLTAADADGDLVGIAIVGADASHGHWQYRLTGSWVELGAVSDTAARLLPATARLRFVPILDWAGSAAVTFRAWDGFAGVDGGVDSIANLDLAAALSPQTAQSVAVVSFRSIDIAVEITSSTSTETVWSISFSRAAAGGGWKLSSPGYPQRNVHLSYNATPFELQAAICDLTAIASTDVTVSGRGSSANPFLITFSGTVRPVLVADGSGLVGENAAPALLAANPLRPVLRNSTGGEGTLVSEILAGVASDEDGDVLGVAVEAVDGDNGDWGYCLAGTTAWVGIVAPSPTAAMLLPGDARIRFRPTAAYSGAATITIRAWDQTSGAAGQSRDLTAVDALRPFSYTAATAEVWVTLRPVSLTTSIVQTAEASAGRNQKQSIRFDHAAVRGTWSLSFAAGSTVDLRFDAVATDVAAGLAALLDTDVANVKVTGNGSAHFPFVVEFIGTLAGQAQPQLVANGSRLVAGNAAPDLYGTNDLGHLQQNSPAGEGTLVSAILAGHAADADADPLGIAVVGVDVAGGAWQYSLNGTAWLALGGTPSAARLLPGEARVRFVPAANFKGRAAIEVRAWDQTVGRPGEEADTSSLSSSSAFSLASAAAAVVVGGDIRLSANTVTENAESGTLVGTLSVARTGTFTYSLISGEGDGDNSLFQVVGDRLEVTAAGGLDFESRASYSVRVAATDGSATFAESLAILVVDVNEAPTAVLVLSAIAPRDLPAGTVVGNLLTLDPDVGDQAFGYQFAEDAGDADEDNGAFALVGTTLVTTEGYAYAAGQSYKINLRSTDAGGLFVITAQSFTLLGQNRAPTDCVLSASSVPTGRPAGEVVGTFSAVDPDAPDDTAHFELVFVDGDGDADNGAFTIDAGGRLILQEASNQASKPSYKIAVRLIDGGGLSIVRTFNIVVTAASPVVRLSADTLPENQAGLVGDLRVEFGAAAGPYTYSLVAGDGDADNALFSVSGSGLVATAAADFESSAVCHVRVRATAAGGETIDQAITISVTDANEAPSDVHLAMRPISRNIPAGAVAGVFTPVDPDAGDTFTYALVRGEGDADNDVFSVDEHGHLLVLPELAQKLGSNRSVRVRLTDRGLLSFETPFQFQVTTGEAPVVALASSGGSLAGGVFSAAGSFSDSDSSAWTATVDYGDGSGIMPLALGTDRSFLLSHTYAVAGTYQVHARVRDSFGAEGLQSMTVTVDEGDFSAAALGIAASDWRNPMSFDGGWGLLTSPPLVLGSGFVPDGTSKFTIAGPANASDTTTSLNAISYWVDAGGVRYRGVQTGTSSFYVTWALAAGGEWTYTESWTASFREEATATDGSSYTGGGTGGYTFVASMINQNGQYVSTGYTFAVNASGSVDGQSKLATAAGAVLCPWHWQTTYNRTITSEGDGTGIGAGNNVGSANTSWSYGLAAGSGGDGFILTTDNRSFTRPSGGTWSASGERTVQEKGSRRAIFGGGSVGHSYDHTWGFLPAASGWQLATLSGRGSGNGAYSESYASNTPYSDGIVRGSSTEFGRDTLTFNYTIAASLSGATVTTAASGVLSSQGFSDSRYTGSGSRTTSDGDSSVEGSVHRTLNSQDAESGYDSSSYSYTTSYGAAGGAWAALSGVGTARGQGYASSRHQASGSYWYELAGATEGRVDGTLAETSTSESSYSYVTTSALVGGAWATTGSNKSTREGGQSSYTYDGQGALTSADAQDDYEGDLTESGRDQSSYQYHTVYALNSEGLWTTQSGSGATQGANATHWALSGKGSLDRWSDDSYQGSCQQTESADTSDEFSTQARYTGGRWSQTGRRTLRQSGSEGYREEGSADFSYWVADDGRQEEDRRDDSSYQYTVHYSLDENGDWSDPHGEGYARGKGTSKVTRTASGQRQYSDAGDASEELADYTGISEDSYEYSTSTVIGADAEGNEDWNTTGTKSETSNWEDRWEQNVTWTHDYSNEQRVEGGEGSSRSDWRRSWATTTEYALRQNDEYDSTWWAMTEWSHETTESGRWSEEGQGQHREATSTSDSEWLDEGSWSYQSAGEGRWSQRQTLRYNEDGSVASTETDRDSWQSAAGERESYQHTYSNAVWDEWNDVQGASVPVDHGYETTSRGVDRFDGTQEDDQPWQNRVAGNYRRDESYWPTYGNGDGRDTWEDDENTSVEYGGFGTYFAWTAGGWGWYGGWYGGWWGGWGWWSGWGLGMGIGGFAAAEAEPAGEVEGYNGSASSAALSNSGVLDAVYAGTGEWLTNGADAGQSGLGNPGESNVPAVMAEASGAPSNAELRALYNRTITVYFGHSDGVLARATETARTLDRIGLNYRQSRIAGIACGGGAQDINIHLREKIARLVPDRLHLLPTGVGPAMNFEGLGKLAPLPELNVKLLRNPEDTTTYTNNKKDYPFMAEAVAVYRAFVNSLVNSAIDMLSANGGYVRIRVVPVSEGWLQKVSPWTFTVKEFARDIGIVGRTTIEHHKGHKVVWTLEGDNLVGEVFQRASGQRKPRLTGPQ